MKKKVGIVTINDNDNYGNRLQNYATQTVLESLGINAITIKNRNRFNNRYNNKITMLKKILGEVHYVLFKDKKRKTKRYKCFKEFNKNIKFTKCIKTMNSKMNNQYDYFIVGSDQVWKPTYERLSEMDLLMFAKPEKRISYAASFGIDQLPEKNKEKTKRELEKFKMISVREEAGKKIVEDLTNRKDVEVLLDPTMMLDQEQWDKVSKKPEMLKEEKYILTYFLGEISEKRKNEINRIAQKYDCKIINILDKNSEFYQTGPSEFLYLEKNAFLICTDSFHSCVFALIYKRPFVVFDREDNLVKMNSRIDTFLNTFKLNNRRFNGTILEENLDNNYEEAYEILNKEKLKSIEFLRKALNLNGEEYNEN